jgi:putative DNA primase/helicase
MELSMTDRALSRNDDDLADLLEVEFRGKFRYDFAMSQWHYWDGLRWKVDVTDHIYDMVRLHAMELLANTTSESKQKALLPLLNVAKKSSVLESLAPRDGFAMTGSEWDTQPNLIGTQDGVLDLETLELHRHPDPDWLVTKQANALFDTQEACPLFMKFVSDIMGGDDELVDYLLTLIGYSMFGHQREQKFWMWLGNGNNGKGTLAKVVANVLGDYGSNQPSNLYMQTRHGAVSSSAPRADLLKLKGQRWTWMSEPQGGKFNDEMLKEHTGDDPITARDLFSKAAKTLVWRPTHTVIILTNVLPNTDDVGASMRRRARVIKFERDFTPVLDLKLEDKLLAERNGIFRRLAAFAQYYSQNGLVEPDKVLEWSNDYIEDNDPIGQFLQDRCVVERGAKANAALIYESFRDWSVQRDLDPMTQNGFGRLMTRRFSKVKTNTGAVYHGVGLLGAMKLAEQDDDGDE